MTDVILLTFDTSFFKNIVYFCLGFSSPVRLSSPQLEREDYLFLLKHDTDSFNRSEAARNVILSMIQDMVVHNTEEPDWWTDAVGALASVLVDENLDPAFRALLLEPPSTSELVDDAERFTADPIAFHHARRKVLDSISRRMVSVTNCFD